MIEQWKCSSCGEIRDDKDISVFSYPLYEGDDSIICNLKYCNDKPECLEKAQLKAITNRT